MLVLFLYWISLCFGQVKGDYVWQLGLDSHPQENPYALSIVLDFNIAGVYMDTFYRGMTMGYFNASISDDEGKLLAYSNGCRITDGNHINIPGTLSLSPGDTDWANCRLNPPTGYPNLKVGCFYHFIMIV